jgi:hypothetical protein
MSIKSSKRLAIRWCFASSSEKLAEGADRLERFLSAR